MQDFATHELGTFVNLMGDEWTFRMALAEENGFLRIHLYRDVNGVSKKIESYPIGLNGDFFMYESDIVDAARAALEKKKPELPFPPSEMHLCDTVVRGVFEFSRSVLAKNPFF